MTCQQLEQELSSRFGPSEEETGCFFSPGRVNLIGEHTDYNGGYVFPCALSFGTYLAARKNTLGNFRMASGNMSFFTTVPFSEITKRIGKEWVNYPLGVINEFIRNGHELTGMDLYYYGNVPNGAGLSSSASIEMVTALAISRLFGYSYSMIDLVKMAQRAENVFVGVNCGIMDQFASGMGKKDHAIFLDCNSLQYELVPVKLEGYKMIIANTNKRRRLADSKYNERRSECDKAVTFLKSKRDIRYLCDLSIDDFRKFENIIPDETIRRRARHVITENQRVVDAVEELRAGRILNFGMLMNASHDSLQYDYEVTGIELDSLVSEARKIEGVIGSRMTGAGFGGCTVSIVADESVETFTKEVEINYKELTGLQADFYVADIGDGAHAL